ncbi:MAG: twin-arginine translocase TatA/TatE family subunit [Verrucomicrobiota bacterium]
MFSGPWEWILVVLLVLLLFGHKKVPDLARALGRSLSEFKKGRAEGENPDSQQSEPGKDESSPADSIGKKEKTTGK